MVLPSKDGVYLIKIWTGTSGETILGSAFFMKKTGLFYNFKTMEGKIIEGPINPMRIVAVRELYV